MKHLSWIIAFPFAVIVISFAVSNPEPVALRVWPVPYMLEAPVFLVVLASVGFGIVWGGLTAWAGGMRVRSRMRRAEVQAEAARRDVRRLQSVIEESSKSSADAGKKPAASAAPVRAALPPVKKAS